MRLFMPETNDLNEADIAFIYTEIGRGHPGYLNGIIEQFEKSYPNIAYYQTDVFTASKGFTLLTWYLVKYLYRIGARGGIVTFLYGFIRRFSGTGGMSLYWLGHDIRKLFTGYTKPIIVAHPILARILSRQCTVIYQHGELAAPVEAIVSHCQKILIPLRETARVFETSGIKASNMVITGQCIESNLIVQAESAFKKRADRISSLQNLTAAMFSSGAYPPAHLKKLYLAGQSLFEAGYTVIFFTGASYKINKATSAYFKKAGLPISQEIDDTDSIKIILSTGRQEENDQVAAIFNNLDFFIAPSHERTNWAVGLGLPLFILRPHIGSYAPLNAVIALKCGVAQEIPDNTTAAGISKVIGELRKSGRLLEMAKCGYSHTDINGFTQSARTASEMIRGNDN